jgi:hypothetical protein
MYAAQVNPDHAERIFVPVASTRTITMASTTNSISGWSCCRSSLMA